MNLNAFPFYSTLQQQSRYTVPGYSYTMPLYVPANRLLPFIIAKPKNGVLIDCVQIYTEAGALAYTIQAADFSYTAYADETTEYIVYFGATLPVTMACGKYYAVVAGFFSEVFTVVNNLSSLLKVEYSNTKSINHLLYQAGFSQVLYLAATLAEPTRKYTEEGDDNEQGTFIPAVRRLDKILMFEAGLLTPAMADVLASLQLHDKVNIGSYSEVKQLRAKDSYPEASGQLAVMAVEFSETAPVIAKLCAEPYVLTDITSSYSPAAWKCDSSSSAADWQPTGNVRCVQA